ncbi:MAG: DUF481 domain-containing protein [Gammaproteobacteria bacterium]|nr:DUF481 domain-containing protein [Gammaproteobacteria bacterium]
MKNVICLIFTCLLINQSYADTISLSNGDNLNGTIIRKEDNALVFSTDYAGEIKIQWDHITAITTDKPLQIILNNDTSIEKASITSSDNNHIIKTDGIKNPVEVQLSSIKYINPTAEVSGKGVKITGRVNIGLSIASGNSDTENLNIDSEVILRGKQNRTTAAIKIYKASDSGVSIEQKTNALLKYDHFLDGNDYIYGNTSFIRDKFKDRKLKSTIGLGYGHQFIESDARNLSLETGLNYVNDDYFIAADEDYVAGRWALRFDQQFFNSKLQFFHIHEGLLDLDNTNNLSIITQTGFRFPILENMNATLQLNLDRDKTTPVGIKNTDKKILFSVGYTW